MRGEYISIFLVSAYGGNPAGKRWPTCEETHRAKGQGLNAAVASPRWFYVLNGYRLLYGLPAIFLVYIVIAFYVLFILIE
jgi:hypothetical protein